jgi:hypothetical protein
LDRAAKVFCVLDGQYYRMIDAGIALTYFAVSR